MRILMTFILLVASGGGCGNHPKPVSQGVLHAVPEAPSLGHAGQTAHVPEAKGEWYYARKAYVVGSTHAYLWNSQTGELLEDSGGSSGPANVQKVGGPLNAHPGDIAWKDPDPKTGRPRRDARPIRNPDGSRLTIVQEEKMRSFMLEWREFNFLWFPYIRDCHDAVDQALALIHAQRPAGTDRFDPIGE